MEHAKNKAITFMNDALRDYVYGPRRWFSPLRFAFVVMVAFVASLMGNAFAHYMVPATVDNGSFIDGYTHRYWFEVGAVAFIVVAMLTRRVFRALCAAYVRRLDMDDAIANGSEETKCAGDSNAKPADDTSHIERRADANGDYVSAVDSSEDTISESEGGDA